MLQSAVVNTALLLQLQVRAASGLKCSSWSPRLPRLRQSKPFWLTSMTPFCTSGSAFCRLQSETPVCLHETLPHTVLSPHCCSHTVLVELIAALTVSDYAGMHLDCRSQCCAFTCLHTHHPNANCFATTVGILAGQSWHVATGLFRI